MISRSKEGGQQVSSWSLKNGFANGRMAAVLVRIVVSRLDGGSRVGSDVDALFTVEMESTRLNNPLPVSPLRGPLFLSTYSKLWRARNAKH